MKITTIRTFVNYAGHNVVGKKHNVPKSNKTIKYICVAEIDDPEDADNMVCDDIVLKEYVRNIFHDCPFSKFCKRDVEPE